jgi:hypothetical protein
MINTMLNKSVFMYKRLDQKPKEMFFPCYFMKKEYIFRFLLRQENF